MKKFIFGLIASSFLLISVPAAAENEKITITGEPVVIMEEQGVYVPQTDLKTEQDNYFLTMNDTRVVCFTEVNPTLVDLNANILQVKVGEETMSLHCYDFSPDYFVIE